jgi:hypothetical protein
MFGFRMAPVTGAQVPQAHGLSHVAVDRALRLTVAIVAWVTVLGAPIVAQNAQLSGFVRDAQETLVVRARITLTNLENGTIYETASNDRGLYVIGSIRPGSYRLDAEAPGFARVIKQPLIFEVGSVLALNIDLAVSTRAETVAVSAEVPLLSTRDGSRGTVIERDFVANMPLSGRTMHSLIALAPGVVNVPTTAGAFNVNGQRASANYMLIDGVAGNLGVSTGSMRDSAAGQSLNTTLLGGLNGSASLESIQEFRIQTSSVAPEYGRTPGAQISLVTRSGTSAVHFSVFEQFRSDRFDATNWFVNNRGQGKPEMHQHSFGGTIGGPLMRHTYYFAAYEGLRLLQPRTVTGAVPTLDARQLGSPAARAFLSSFPTPTGAPTNGRLAEFATNASDRVSNHAPSVRVDRSFGSRTQAFVRYAHTTSENTADNILSKRPFALRLNSVTTGVTHTLGSSRLLDVRVNYGANDVRNTIEPLQALPFVPALPASRYSVVYSLSGTGLSFADQGGDVRSRQAQANLIASYAQVAGTHQLKAGVDYRRLSPEFAREDYRLQVTFSNVDAVLNDTASSVSISRFFPVNATMHNVALYAQDTWRPTARVSVTYGLRWDVNPAPSFDAPGGPLAATNLENPQLFAFEPNRGAPLWETSYKDIAPRLGASLTLDDEGRHIVTGGAGIFYDLIQGGAGDSFVSTTFPNTTVLTTPNVRVPLTSADLAGVASPSLTPPYLGTVAMVDPRLVSPRTTQWNVSYEWLFSASQAVSAAYVGARGERLLTGTVWPRPNTMFPGNVTATYSAGESRYDSLQVQYRRRARSMRTLASYTLGRSEDTGSSTSGLRQEALAPSDFDVRHNLAVAVSFDGPTESPRLGWLTNGWGLDLLGRFRSPLAVTPTTSVMIPGLFGNGPQRADRVDGVPLYVDDPSAPTGRRFNPAAFTVPPVTRQGTADRNSLRGYYNRQLDLAIRRDIPIPVRGGGRIQLRIDAYNLFNTANFASPTGVISSPQFGRPLAMLNELGGSPGDQLGSLYQWGGPRSIEFSVRVRF